MQIKQKKQIAKKLVRTEISETPKKDHLNADTRQTIGLNKVTFCQKGGNIEIEQKLPPKNTNGVIIKLGTKFNCSKFSAHIPKIKPSKLNDIQVNNKKISIQNGCKISSDTKKFEVINIIIPIEKDFVAAAPTNPITISTKETGADKCSYMDPVNFGKQIPKEEFETL